VLNNGWNRDVPETPKAVRWLTQPLMLELAEPSEIGSVHLTLQHRNHHAAFIVECLTDEGWQKVADVKGREHQRRYVVNIEPITAKAVRFTLKESPGPLAVSEIRIYKDQGWTTQFE